MFEVPFFLLLMCFFISSYLSIFYFIYLLNFFFFTCFLVGGPHAHTVKCTNASSVASALFYHCSPMKQFSLTHLFSLLFTHPHSSVRCLCYQLNSWITPLPFILFSPHPSFKLFFVSLIHLLFFVLSEPYPLLVLLPQNLPQNCDVFCYEIIFVPCNNLAH